jgi:predicted secreted Zn-dependent protease
LYDDDKIALYSLININFMELTKEQLEDALNNLATKTDIAGLVTKIDAEATEERIINRIDEAQEELARMTAAGFEDIQKQLDVTEKMKTFELKFRKLEEALHIKL